MITLFHYYLIFISNILAQKTAHVKIVSNYFVKNEVLEEVQVEVNNEQKQIKQFQDNFTVPQTNNIRILQLLGEYIAGGSFTQGNGVLKKVRMYFLY